MKIVTSRILNKVSRPFIIVLVCLLAQAPSIIGQTITVLVKAESPLDVEQIEIVVMLTESKLDYDLPELPNSQMPELISSEKFLLELKGIQLESAKIDSETVSKKHYSRFTKKEQTETTVESSFQIIVNSNEDLAKFKELMSKSPNAKIISTNYSSKNEESTINKLTEKVLKDARIRADKMGERIGKRTTNLSNLKVLNMQTRGQPNQLLLYILEQKAYLELEVTYETENL